MRDKQLVLIVDDARDIVRGLSLRLRAAGYDVLMAYDGKMGLDLAIEARPDLILVDIRMPVMDGLMMLALLRENKEARAIPTIVLSANIAEQARVQALQLGAKYFLEKPYDAKTVLRAVRSALDELAVSPAASATG